MAEATHKHIFLIGDEKFDTEVVFNSGDGRGHDSIELHLTTTRGINTNTIVIADIRSFEAIVTALNNAKDEFYKAWAELPECCQKQYG